MKYLWRTLPTALIGATLSATSADAAPMRDTRESSHALETDTFSIRGSSTADKARATGIRYRLAGSRAIYGAQRDSTLEVRVSAPLEKLARTLARGVQLDVQIRRHEFGLNWHDSLDTIGLVLCDDLVFDAQVKLTK